MFVLLFFNLLGITLGWPAPVFNRSVFQIHSMDRCLVETDVNGPLTFSPMTDSYNQDDKYLIPDLVNDTVGSLTYPVSILA